MLGLGAFAQMVLILVAGLFSIVGSNPRTPEDDLCRAQWVFRLLLASAAAAALGLAAQVLAGGEESNPIPVGFAMSLLKVILCVPGMFLLLPMGVTDMIIGPPQKPAPAGLFYLPPSRPPGPPPLPGAPPPA